MRLLPILIVTTVMAGAALRAPGAAQTAPATQPGEASKAEKLFAEGRDALFRREYDLAIRLLRQACAEDPNKTSYRLHLARALRYSGRTAEAQPLLEAILKAAPDHVEAGQFLAEIHAERQDWKAVLAVLEPLLKYRHEYQTYHLLGEAAYQMTDPDKARKYFEEAVRLNPRSPADHYQLGNIYLAGNRFALAAEAYENALRLGMKSAILHYKLGTAYFNLRNYFGTISTVTVKSGREGTISGEWYLIEPVPGRKDMFRAAPSNTAIYQIAKAVAEGIEDRADLKFLRANIYLNAGRYQQAYQMYGQMRELIPKEDRALFFHYYAQAAFGVGKLEEYLSLLNEAIKLNKAAYQPMLVEAYLKVAEQYNQAGDLAKYIEYLNRAVRESPQTASLHLKLGNACEEANRYADAVMHWQMVLDLEPDHPRRLELLTAIAKNRARVAPPATRPS